MANKVVINVKYICRNWPEILSDGTAKVKQNTLSN